MGKYVLTKNLNCTALKIMVKKSVAKIVATSWLQRFVEQNQDVTGHFFTPIYRGVGFLFSYIYITDFWGVRL